MRLSQKDFHSASLALEEIYSAVEKPDFSRLIINTVSRLVAADITAYNEVDHSRESIIIEHDFQPAQRVTELAPTLAAHAHEHPVNEYHRRTGDNRSLKISDFLSDREFRRLGLYHEFYRQLEVSHQISLYLPSSPALQIAITLQRRNRDFSERDRAVLNFLSPHLATAHALARRFCFINERFSALATGFTENNQLLLFVRTSGVVEWSSGDLSGFLASAGCESAIWNPIPELLRERLLSGPRLFSLETKFGSLQVAIRKRDKSSVQLLLEFRRAARHSDILRQFGLTPRELEILQYITEGKTNPEIALILDLSARTVHKHVEHILQKLKVENRASAAVMIRDLKFYC
jgi:DNA-binding CsgD family transcriptional regulator